MIDMSITLTINDLVTQLSGSLESRDAIRLAELKRTASLATAEKAAMQTEYARLVKKYGANSQQATEASGRVSALEQQRAGLAGDVTRAATPTPAVEAGVFVVYGRILDDLGGEVAGAKVVAATTDGSALASTSSKSQGMFELRVPLQARKKAAKEEKKDQAEEASVSFQIVVTAKNLERPYVSAEILTGVSKRLAYREIALPGSSKKSTVK